MIIYSNGRGRMMRDLWQDVGATCLTFIFEAIPFLIFSLIMGLLWFMGITAFTMTTFSF